MLKKRTRLGIRHRTKRLNREAVAGNRTKDPAEKHTPAEIAETADLAYKRGFENGQYEGGEKWLENAVPQNMLLPEVSLQEIIAIGVEQLKPRCYPLLEPHEVFAQMEQALTLNSPCAVVRLGDGELLALSQDVVYNTGALKQEGEFLPYAGLHTPDIGARDQLALAVRHAQIVGVPLSRRKHFQPLLYPVLRGHGLNPGTLRLTQSTINYGLYQAGLLRRLLTNRKLLVIGNAAPALAQVLVEQGFIVSGVISPVNGFADIDRVIDEVRPVIFDLALVSAGIPAVVICWRIAAERGKVALDFGHMADAMVKGNVTL
ncbi:GT-D fold domain-containing protein [Paenibacillus nasutitermitis]|uniref:GT-D fold-like domain-containing protein n=1 Tax=Paenibacillus nasutitermitis TaxID=1652958 RepID=A0A917DN39_9BACL|nr:GT-D fold domain-containing glycosyltransferase [Paenibacillus nasutitermitis]GGD49843.1 hypothetical protein GCM10010911_04230 [Paenibacillus nasutitermitis]